MKVAESAWLLLLATAGCATPAKDRPLEPAHSAALAGSASPRGQDGAGAAPAGSVPSARAPAPAPAPSGASATGSAYFGCGQAIPPANLWDETREAEVLEAISAAKRCAAEHGRRLLLEFVAPWCEDCREMAKLDETAVVADTLRTRFERVRINVGKWDRHEALRNNFGVNTLATYIVIDPKTSKRLAKTTLEPVTKRGQKLSAEQWASWLGAH